MTRGNQREIDRARAAKRNAGGATAKDKDGLTASQRKERCGKVCGMVSLYRCLISSCLCDQQDSTRLLYKARARLLRDC